MFATIEQRLKRYNQAKIEPDMKLYLLAEAYRLSLPTRAEWLISGEQSLSIDRTRYHWDSTAIQSLKSFASNIQSILMPPFKQWASFKPASSLSDESKNLLQPIIENVSAILNNAFDASNLLLESNIAFQDMGIAVGLLQIKSTSNKNSPLSFHAIPMHDVALGQFNGEITDIYRRLVVPARDILALWPDAKLSNALSVLVNDSPNEPVKLLEGTIYYPMNKDGEKYQYFVMESDGHTDLVNRKQSMSRWIPFRFSVSPGQVWGDGPVLQILDAIRVANQMVELDMLNGAFTASKPFFINGSTILNPNTIQIKPGAQIHVNDTSPGSLPIVPLELGNTLKFDQVKLGEIQEVIRNALFVDPFGPQQTVNQTATEAQLRAESWMRESAASIGRITTEFTTPLILKSCVILQKLGLFPNEFHIDENTMEMTINGQVVHVDILSPLATQEDKDEAQNVLSYAQMLQGILGPDDAIQSLNPAEIGPYLADKLNIPSNIYKSAMQYQQAANEENQAQLEQNAQQLSQEQTAATAKQANQPVGMPTLQLG